MLSPLNQECGGEEVDEVEEFEIENSMENWVGPMKVMVKETWRWVVIENLASQFLYHAISYKTDKILFDVDLEIELKTILYDTFDSVCEWHLQVKGLANEVVREFDEFSDNRYSEHDMYNNQVVSHPCGNNPTKGKSLYDDIDDWYTLSAGVS